MKALPVLFGTMVVIMVASTTFGEVEVKQAPLTWQQAALSDGEQLYLELCAVCHGKSGMGDGPAASALKKAVPDLTGLAAANEGEFPRHKVEQSIAGESRVTSHGTIDMPIWGQAFKDVRPDMKQFRRDALARQRIFNLTEYLATIQAE
jgi:mono/diheme cytochrome c family protein